MKAINDQASLDIVVSGHVVLNRGQIALPHIGTILLQFLIEQTGAHLP
jgi:hypothetical protein